MSATEGTPRIRGGVRFASTRIEALADGIFAVAMTLLVLDVKLPNDMVFATSDELLAHLLAVGHTFLIYLVSFIVLGMFWVGHHAQFHFVRYVDHTLLWLNLFFLFGITSIPFATDLLGDYHALRLPYLLYGYKLLILTLLLIAQILYLRRHPELAHPSLTPWIARRIVGRALVFAVIPIVSMLVVDYNANLALYLYFLLPVIHFLPGRIDQGGPDGAADNDESEAGHPS
jgi:uncharacterized membrane protein